MIMNGSRNQQLYQAHSGPRLSISQPDKTTIYCEFPLPCTAPAPLRSPLLLQECSPQIGFQFFVISARLATALSACSLYQPVIIRKYLLKYPVSGPALDKIKPIYCVGGVTSQNMRRSSPAPAQALELSTNLREVS